MRLRLAGLLAIAAAAGLMVGAVTSAGAEKQQRRPAALAKPLSARTCPVPARYRAAFELAALDTDLPVALLLAVARVESNLEHEARSAAGARGLLQLMPTTAAELKLDADHPPSNVLAGARYLRLMLDRFHSTDLALAAYNAGPSAVVKAGGAPTQETLSYVDNVTRLWRSFAGCS